MKIQKISKSNYKLLKLQLIKTYKKNTNDLLKINEIVNRVKKVLFIIYKYHIKRKRILFVGNPLQNNINLIKLLNYNKHFIVPEFFRMNGVISNKSSLKNKKKTVPNLYKLKKQSHLLIILNDLSNKTLINEGYNSKIPIISLNNNLNIFDYKSSYKIPNDHQITKAKKINTLFYSIIISTLKKADITLQKFLKIEGGLKRHIKILKNSYNKQNKKKIYYYDQAKPFFRFNFKFKKNENSRLKNPTNY